jgi:5-methyltetrahydropteroyltriglutamate--homocysteine methyltransferase
VDRLQRAASAAFPMHASALAHAPSTLGYAMSSSSLRIATLGVPRIGPRRELKFALESYWSRKGGGDDLLRTAADLRAASWRKQQTLGITEIPSNDFSLYDHVLDTSVMVGAIPEPYGWRSGAVSLETYFAMARGTADEHTHEHGHSHAHEHHGDGIAAQEMTKWFDTNYHYMVPELSRSQTFALAYDKPIAEYRDAKALGIATRPVLLGPVTYLKLAKTRDGSDPLALLPALTEIYAEVLRWLSAEGAEWVQIDEPCLVLDLDGATQAAFADAYRQLSQAVPGIKLMLTTYFGGLGNNLDLGLSLPVAGLHLDLVRAPEQLDEVVRKAPSELTLSFGVIDGRNIWRGDFTALLDRLEPVVTRRGTDRVMLAPSCSLMHVPIDLDAETELDDELRSWLAFGDQKMTELAILGRALGSGRASVAAELSAASAAFERRRRSPRVHGAEIAARLARIVPDMLTRKSPASTRLAAQHARLALPDYPTTTIGSFPQTKEVREARAAYVKGAIGEDAYNAFLRDSTLGAIRWQEEIGLDVLVHGEFERNDMVQYFGERLAGFAFTKHAWVQSYGSRCVRPPILYGDVSRPAPMTVEWWRYAQSVTERPVKAMLTGPVTILNWSFVRDDIPRSESCRQIALAIRDEVLDLEAAGAKMIQIDEAALREGLPLRKADWADYLAWAVECFHIASSGVRDETQIHTHMCYSEFNDIIASIAAMDADVISIETSRSKMELLDAFADFHYPAEIGPDVYDIHSPRVPSADEMADLLVRASARLSPD